MRKLLALFSALAITFAGIWVYKMKTPEGRPDSYKNGVVQNYWWNSVGEAEEEVNTNWRLSDGVPSNYIPVPGRKELYMVVDEDGYIIGYKIRKANPDTGEWEWSDTNPDIPENYEAVPGLENVYKVTADDGSVSYFKYVRNKDDTYAFVEVDAKGNLIGVKNPEGNEIPDNYERVNRTQYAVKNNNGVTIGYKERVINPQDGGVQWIDVKEDDIAEKKADANVSIGFNLDSDATGKGDATGGTRPSAGRIGNNTTIETTIDIPTLMPQQNTASSQGGTFIFMQPSQQTTITERVYVTAPPLGNNENVQVITVPGNAGGQTVVMQPEANPQGQNMPGSMDIPGADGGGSSFIDNMKENLGKPVVTPAPGSQIPGGQMPGVIDMGGTVTPIPQGILSGGINTHIEQESTGYNESTEIIRTQEEKDGYLITYAETIVTITDANGNTTKNTMGKQEIAREPINGGNVDATNIASTLSEESKRIQNLLLKVVKAKYNAGVPNDLSNKLISYRLENQKPAVVFDGNNPMYQIALNRAAMMALTNTSDKNLPSYGTVSNMCSKYGVAAYSPSENMYVTTSLNADTIHSIFVSNSQAAMLNEGYTKVAIAIAEYNGRYYIDEILY